MAPPPPIRLYMVVGLGPVAFFGVFGLCLGVCCVTFVTCLFYFLFVLVCFLSHVFVCLWGCLVVGVYCASLGGVFGVWLWVCGLGRKGTVYSYTD